MTSIWHRSGPGFPWLLIEHAGTAAEAKKLLALCRASGEYHVGVVRPGENPKIDKRIAEKPFRYGTTKLRSDVPDASVHRVSRRR